MPLDGVVACQSIPIAMSREQRKVLKHIDVVVGTRHAKFTSLFMPPLMIVDYLV